jgi:ribosomal protein S18 acetylase RimI-like enzyme
VIVVREVRPSDEAEVQRVFDEAFAPVRRIYRPSEEMIAAVGKSELERLVAVEDERVVGTVRFGTGDDRLRVIGLAVAPSHQRRGIARALIDRLSEIAILRDLRVLALFTIEQTGNALVFERLGFEVISEQPDTSSISVGGDDLIELYMERPVGKTVT